MATDNAGARPAVLVTRPAGAAADALCAAVRDAGYRAVAQPLLEVQALAELPAAARAMVMDLDHYAAVIFISSNAVRCGMQRLQDYWPQLPLGIQWYAVGAATARMLDAYGLRAQAPADMTSEGLLRLPGLQDVAGLRVLIVKGQGGRDALRRELSGRGARVDELACYRRRCPELAAGALARTLREESVGVILLSSGEGLHNLLQLLSPSETSNFNQMRLVVPSERVARQAADAGFEHVVTADNASDAAMLRALEHCPTALEKT
ncbi:MAG: uroporphyrinogen-III synthase [Halioglobus sp.]|nr:uroporphyrinogen-III synthase [Halioglobus sp.]